VVKIYSGEDARYKGKPLYRGILSFVSGLGISARCLVTRGVAGSYENGELCSEGLEVLSMNMPLEITVLFPAAENDKVLPVLDGMVEDGLMLVDEKEIRWHKRSKRLIPARAKVLDVMTRAPKTVGGKASAAEVLKLLWKSGFHSVPVVDKDGRPVGIVTNGDLVRRAKVPLKAGLLDEFQAHHMKPLEDELSKLAVSAIMTAPAVTVPEDGLLSEAAELMLRRGLKRLPVTGRDGRLTGVISRLDIFKTILEKNPDWGRLRKTKVVVTNDKTVTQALRTDTPVLAPGASVEEALRLIETTDIKRVAVVDEKGKLLGLISDRVLLAVLLGHKTGLWEHLAIHLPFLSPALKRKELAAALKAKTARDVMNTDLFLLKEDEPLEDAIKLMVEKKLKRIPVVDADGIFKGMLTRDSLLRAEMHTYGG
jgi:CBS domain-containing protein